MPRKDGTGPFGTGGRCTTGTGLGLGRRNGLGMGRGMGMGMGRGNGVVGVGGVIIREEDELRSLKGQATVIEEHLATIKNRISELEEK